MTTPASAARPPPGLIIREFRSPAAAAEALAAAVADDLSQAIRQRGTATLAVSGGTTPAGFLRDRGTRPLQWPLVRVTLTDERWVPAGSPRANATLVAGTLLAGAARDCRWQPLYCDGLARPAGLARLNDRLAAFGWPLDVAVLGMGEDGHVASLFPGAASWDSPDTHIRVIAANAPTGEERVSLTLATLRAARHRYLLLHGVRKAAVLQQPAALPVGALTKDAFPPVFAFVSLEDSP